jgi:acetylglutamate kinase
MQGYAVGVSLAEARADFHPFCPQTPRVVPGAPVTQPPPPTPATTPADVVLTFLESLGRRAEAELYLRTFRELPKESFAIIAPGPQVLRDGLGALIEQIRFLADLDLFTTIVLGLIDPSSSAQGAERVARRLSAAGLVPYVHSMAEPHLVEELIGELRAERIPVVHFAVTEGEGVDARLKRLGDVARVLDTRKVVMLRRRGGIALRGDRPLVLDGGRPLGQVGWLSVVNLRTDRAPLTASKRLAKRDGELIEYAARLIELVDPTPLVVSVASPLNLMKELFTVKGAGTLIKRGTPIARHDSYDALDVAKLRALVETSFGRTLLPDFFERAPLAVYLDEQYRGAAVLHAGTTVPYLTKFAVLPQAQGEGMGYDLFQALARDHACFFWRTRQDNPILPWYLGVCDGMAKTGSWCVLWRGVEPSRIPEVVAEAEALPTDFSS